MAEKRRSPRVAAGKETGGRLKATVPIVIRNVSREGMLFEVSTPLRPGAVYDLKTEIPGFDFSAQLRITRCRAGGYVEDGRGGRILRFEAGAEFQSLDEAAIKELSAWIARCKHQKSPSSATLHAPRTEPRT